MTSFKIRSIFVRDRRIRSGWRIFIFLAVAFPPLYYLSILLWDEYLLRYFILFSLLLLLSFLAARFLDRRPTGTIGFLPYPGFLGSCFLGVLIGFLLVSILFLLLIIPGYVEISIRTFSVSLMVSIFLVALPITLLQSAFEELFFRGYVFQNVMTGINTFSAILITSAVFGLGHMLTPHSSWIVCVNLSIFGAMHAICYIRTRSLYLPSGLHFGWNFFMRNIYSLPVSGTATSASLLKVTDTGPAWITGGEYGPEAGIPALLLMIIVTAWIYFTKRMRVPREMEKAWDRPSRS